MALNLHCLNDISKSKPGAFLSLLRPKAHMQATSWGTVKLARDHCDPKHNIRFNYSITTIKCLHILFYFHDHPFCRFFGIVKVTLIIFDDKTRTQPLHLTWKLFSKCGNLMSKQSTKWLQVKVDHLNYQIIDLSQVLNGQKIVEWSWNKCTRLPFTNYFYRLIQLPGTIAESCNEVNRYLKMVQMQTLDYQHKLLALQALRARFSCWASSPATRRRGRSPCLMNSKASHLQD